MCGIAGVLLPNRGWVAKESVEAMTETLRHRGPDGEGFYRNRGVALGHRRLNVIDIDGGRQPMSNEDGTIWVTYNGEIYDFDALRADLVARGHRFQSRCDTEVIVHGYEEWGDAVVERLSGMFAFALWDGGKRRALLARDRMGQKPLFYAQLDDGRLLFGSEAKAIVAHPDLPAAVDPEALATYLTFEYLPGSLSMFRGVKKLPPGHILTFEGGRVAKLPYWDIPFGEPGPKSRREAKAMLAEAFDGAVKRRLEADVPLGIFLSGGIDSSAVAAVATRHRPPESVKTFSIGFEDESYDESSHARLVAEHLGTDHHERIFSVSALIDTLPKVIDKLDEPFGDASLLPTYLLSAFTRESVTVALGGDGGDELLLGYPTFAAERAARIYRRLPTSLHRLLGRQLAGMSIDNRNFSLEFVVKSFMRAAGRSPETRHPLWLGSVIPHSADDPLEREFRNLYPLERVLLPAIEPFNKAADTERQQRLSYQYCKTYLAEDILVKVDRASMAVSLEARSPFLDPEVVRVAATTPARFKLSPNFQAKQVLKDIMRDHLPASTLDRKKKGFGIPLADWLEGPLKETMTDLLAPDRIKSTGLLKPAVVSRLVDEHLKGRRNNRKILWTLLSFELWRDRYGLS